MDNLRYIGELAGLSKPEQSAIKHYLISHDKDLSLAKSQFEKDFGRRVTAQAIKSVLTKFEAEINQELKEERTNPELHPLFHLTERLKRWDHLYDLALKPDAITLNLRIDRDNHEVREKKDVKTAAAVLKGAAWDAINWEKIQVEKAKLNKGGTGDDNEDSDDPEMSNVAGW